MPLRRPLAVEVFGYTLALSASYITYWALKKFFAKKAPPMDPSMMAEFRVSGPGVAERSDLYKWIVEMMDEAEVSIDLSFHTVTFEGFVDAIIRAKNRGVEVRLTMQYAEPEPGSQLLRMRRESVRINMVHLPTTGRMEPKIIIIDNKRVIFGTMDLTAEAALDNEEEMVKLVDPPTVAKFIRYFTDMWDATTNDSQLRAALLSYD